MDESKKLVLGEKLTVRTLPGREGQTIGRLPDGRVVLFDQKSQYFELLAPGQSVEGHLIVISENYVILSPTSEPEEAVVVHHPPFDMDDVVEDLEELIETVSGNAEVIPRALLRLIQLNQLLIRILKGEA